MKDKLNQAIEELKVQQCSFVLIKDGQENTYSSDIGLKPIMTILRVDRLGLEGGVIADKVIGKAAALMLVLSKAKAVHGQLMSETAVVVLEKYDIEYSYDELVPYIENRTKTGPCPLELAVADIDEPEPAFSAIEKKIAMLMKSN